MSLLILSPLQNSGLRLVLAVSLSIMIIVSGAAVQAQDTATADETPAVAVDMAFGADIDRTTRTLVGESSEFAADGFSAEEGRVFCLTRVRNMVAPATMTHVWYYEGKTMARVELNVGSSNWRTWSAKRILPAWTGNWEVKVLDASGMVLASAGFTIK